MNSDLLECKVNAKEMVALQNPPRYKNERKKGYMDVMSELWSKHGYLDLGLSSQNLRDQAPRLEKTFGNVQDTILGNAGDQERQLVEHGEGVNLLFEDQESNTEAEQSNAENLYTYLKPEDPKNPVLNLARTKSWRVQHQYLP